MSAVKKLKKSRVHAGTLLSVVFQGEVNIKCTTALAKAINSGNDKEADEIVEEALEGALSEIDDGNGCVSNVDFEALD